MDEPQSLDSVFKEKIFRIPDYQRGYAWQRDQLKAFWEDLDNLSSDRSHYTGVLTLKAIPASSIAADSKEFWLVDDYSYQVYHVVDGQQRLTTFIIFLQALVEFFKQLPDNQDKPEDGLYISDTLSLATVQSRYLFEVKPTGDKFRTYKFGYTEDNPSDNYLRYHILGEPGGGSAQESFYTLNMSNALRYFSEQFRALHNDEGVAGLQEIYRKLTKRFLFNEYIIKDDFDVFVAFETMNNRGKKLSDLELLKNRLIYLTTLYTDDVLDEASRRSLRETINDTWKEVYHQLGRNKLRPLNDDDFLRAHWTMYFKYSRKTGRDYIRFLLDEQFTPQSVHKKTERQVVLESAEEQRSESDIDDHDDASGDIQDETETMSSGQLLPTDIRDYVNSLRESAVHWFNSFYPDVANGMSLNEWRWIDRLNRVGMAYFRPLMMAILKNEQTEAARIRSFKRIERFIFIAFRMTSFRANYRSSEFYNAARALDRGEITLETISDKLDVALSSIFNNDGTLRVDDFYNVLLKKFQGGKGYYDWSGLRYFLYEYELSLLAGSRQKKVEWSDLLKTEKDKISIEHIYPQTATKEWKQAFAEVGMGRRLCYNGTLGNLLLLSASINSSLQNDSFVKKKKAKYNAAGETLRNGYSDGSHSEIEVSRQDLWGPDQISARGIRLLSFMEKRWDFAFKNDVERMSMLFLECDETNQEQKRA